MGILFYFLFILYYIFGVIYIRNLLELWGENEKNEEINLGWNKDNCFLRSICFLVWSE